MNIPVTGAAPSTPNQGDLFTIPTDTHLQFRDSTNTTQALAFMADVLASNTSVATETARAEAAEGVLTTNLAGEVTRATGAEGVLTTNLSNEVSRATAAEGVLTTNLAAEAATRAAADTTLGASISGEVTRATGAEGVLTTNLSNEVSRATAAEALKANLAGGNVFTTGSQTLAASTTGYASMNIPVTGAAPSTPNQGDLFTIPTDTHLQFRDSTNTTQALAFIADVNSAVSAATLTAGTGININSNVINNTGVLSFNGRTGVVTPAASDYSFSQISGTFTPSQAGAGTYGIDISGNAASITGSITESQVTNLVSNLASINSTIATNLTTAEAYADGAVAGESLARANGDSGTLAAAIAAADAFSSNASNLTSGTVSISLLPSLSSLYVDLTTAQTVGGNKSFTGSTTLAGTTVNGTLSLPAANPGASSPSHVLAMSGTDISSDPTLFQWLVNGSGALDLQTATGNNPAADSGLTIANNGIINFAPGQTFPGTANGTVTNIATGAGLTGGPITTTGTISILTGGVTNAMLANPSLTVSAGTGLTGGGSVALGGSTSLSIDSTVVPTLNAVSNTFTGSITASSFTGNGSNLTNVTASNLAAGSYGNAINFTNASDTFVGSVATANNALALGGLAPASYQLALGYSPAHAGANSDITSLTGLTTALPVSEGGTGTTSTTANQIFASPNGSTGAPSFRSMASADMPAAQRNRTICYIAGSDSPTAAALSATNDSIGTYFVNTIGSMTLNSVICYTNSGTATMNFSEGAIGGLLLPGSFTCSNSGTTTTFSAMNSGNPVISPASDYLGLSIFSGATATRATVCISATVN